MYYSNTFYLNKIKTTEKLLTVDCYKKYLFNLNFNLFYFSQQYRFCFILFWWIKLIFSKRIWVFFNHFLMSLFTKKNKWRNNKKMICDWFNRCWLTFRKDWVNKMFQFQIWQWLWVQHHKLNYFICQVEMKWNKKKDSIDDSSEDDWLLRNESIKLMFES